MPIGDVPICRDCGHYMYPTDFGLHRCSDYKDNFSDFIYAVSQQNSICDAYAGPPPQPSEMPDSRPLVEILREKVNEAVSKKINALYEDIVELVKNEASHGIDCTRYYFLAGTKENIIEEIATRLRNEGCVVEISLQTNRNSKDSLLISWQ